MIARFNIHAIAWDQHPSGEWVRWDDHCKVVADLKGKRLSKRKEDQMAKCGKPTTKKKPVSKKK